MKFIKFIPLFFLLGALLLPLSSHTAHAATCYEDQCDGTHDSVVGCNSPSSGLVELGTPIDLTEQDGPNTGRLDGTLHFFEDSLGSVHCNTAWGTVYAHNTYATFYHVFTYRAFTGNEDNNHWETDYTWPNYTTGWKDAPEGGFDESV